jgi:hypothetical protein
MRGMSGENVEQRHQADLDLVAAGRNRLTVTDDLREAVPLLVIRHRAGGNLMSENVRADCLPRIVKSQPPPAGRICDGRLVGDYYAARLPVRR